MDWTVGNNGIKLLMQKALIKDRADQWSRRITKKHRLVYEIHDMEVVILVLTAYGHYDD